MFALGVSFLYGVAIAASIVVAFTVARRADAAAGAARLLRAARAAAQGAPRPGRQGRLSTTDESPGWGRWAGALQQPPGPVRHRRRRCSCSSLAIPFLSIRLGSADAGSDPPSTTTRKAYDLLAKGFGPGFNGPLQLVAKVDPTQQARQQFAQRRQAVAEDAETWVAADAGHGHPGRAWRARRGDRRRLPEGLAAGRVDDRPARTGCATTVIPAAEQGSGPTVLVGGQTAIFEDFSQVLTEQAAAVHRRRRAAVVPAADGGVPQHRRSR